MSYQRKYSLFVSSTYEDLKEERQAVLGVALDSGFIPVGMEQFYAMPDSQWNVITKMIDECDFYLLIIGGRYGSLDNDGCISYTEKEYEYAKSKEIPILVFIRETSFIKQDKMDLEGDKQKKLAAFRNRVKREGNTVTQFGITDDLKYKVSQSLRKAGEYASADAGWVRFSDVPSIINEKVISHGKQQYERMEKIENAIKVLNNEFEDVKNNQLTWTDVEPVTKDDINRMFEVRGEKLIIKGLNEDET